LNKRWGTYRKTRSEESILFDTAWDTDRGREHLRNKVEEEEGNDTTNRLRLFILTRLRNNATYNIIANYWLREKVPKTNFISKLK
jgi:hypothetical protein